MYKFIIASVFVTVVVTQIGVFSQNDGGGVSTECLGCLCEAVSGCNRTKGCNGDICGLFHITWGYWSDAGKPTQPQDNVQSENAFSNCVTEAFCAARTVQGYMDKFKQDCNGDGVITCIDYAHIHKLGGYGCQGQLPDPFKSKLTRCLQEFGAN